ncbi:MAG: DUF4097 domain-containing protein [Gammaproteobacteria bacterium]
MKTQIPFALKLPLALLCVGLCSTSAADKNIDETAKIAPEGRVRVSNVQGSVNVTGWDRNEVRVTGELGEGVERLDIESDGRNVSIEVTHPDNGKRWDWSKNDRDAELDIRVPVRSRLEIDTTSADIEVGGHTGPQRIKSVSGSVELTLSEVEAIVKSISGSIEARGRDVSIDATLESVSGDVEVIGFRGDLEMESVSGDLELRDARLRDADFESVSGDVDLRFTLGSNGEMEIETISGDVSLEFEGVIDATIRVDTHSGSIDEFFGVEPERTRRYGPGRRLRATSGEGNADVSVSTLSGDVRNRTRD